MNESPMSARCDSEEFFSKHERPAVLLIQLGFVLVCLNCIRNEAFMGQDFLWHWDATLKWAADHSLWFFKDGTTRPLLYWIGGSLHLLTEEDPFKVSALLFVVLSWLALAMVHRCTRDLIGSARLRIAAVAFVAFLPPTVISTCVYAADALTFLPFVGVCGCLTRAIQSEGNRKALVYAGLGAAFLCWGNLAKFTFLVLPVGIGVVLFSSVRWGRITGRRALHLGLIVGVIPALFSGWLQVKVTQTAFQEKDRHAFNWKGTGDVRWSTLLGVKPGDVRIFDAPVYWDRLPDSGDKTLVLLQPNSFSYPALLCLGMFTDVLDYAKLGGLDNGTPRPEPQKTLSKWSVRIGVFFFLAIVASALASWGRWVAALVRPAAAAAAPSTPLLVWCGLSTAWYLPLALSLPYVTKAYEAGYWLPRLVMPALWGFALVFFATCDSLLKGNRRRAGIPLAAGCVLLLAALEIGSVWY